MKSQKLLPLFLVLPIGLTLMTGCSAQDSPAQNSEVSAQEVAPEIVINEEDREKSKSFNELEQISVPNSQNFSENNFLKVSNGQKVVVQSYAKTPEGVAVSSDTTRYPAEGEFLHAINIAVEESDTGDYLSVSEDPLNDAVVTIDGVPTESEFRPTGEKTLLVSAPENAEILLKVQTDGVSQSINLSNAERTSVGIAEAWYGPSKYSFDKGNVNQKVAVGKNSGTLKMTFKNAEKTPWNNELSWADGGKSSWLIIANTEPEWTFTGDASSDDEINKVWVTDSKGKKYELDEAASENYSEYDQSYTVFNVPSDEKTFTLHTENSTEISSWGEIVGKTKVISNEFPITLK